MIMKCKICNQSNSSIFTAKILNKYIIEYYYCDCCGFLQTEDPFWLEEAYINPITISDTGYMQRNIRLSKTVCTLLFFFFDRKAKFLDYAGGYGVFVRLMRDIGFDFYWDDKYTQNLFSRGFEYRSGITLDAVTTFESFEHFTHPLSEIEKLLKLSRNIIFSTLLLPTPIPKPADWWYYGLDHGQHISFYSEKTFQYIAKKNDLYYENLGGLHLFSDKKKSRLVHLLTKLTNFGLFALLKKSLASKTWLDHIKASCI